jgi:hypothetical protein
MIGSSGVPFLISLARVFVARLAVAASGGGCATAA